MESCKISQALKLSVIVALLVITPFLSSSLRSTYLYFIFNLLIIALCLESGLLSSVSYSSNEAAPPPPKPPLNAASNTNSNNTSVTISTMATSPDADAVIATTDLITNDEDIRYYSEMKKVVEKSSAASEKIITTTTTTVTTRGREITFNKVVEKSPPSVSVLPASPFFTDAIDDDDEREEEEEEEEAEEKEEVGGLSGQELFNRAENFIGNFYKQLKMQRQESWRNRLHHDFF